MAGTSVTDFVDLAEFVAGSIVYLEDMRVWKNNGGVVSHVAN
jgi:hypothetical protein